MRASRGALSSKKSKSIPKMALGFRVYGLGFKVWGLWLWGLTEEDGQFSKLGSLF